MKEVKRLNPWIARRLAPWIILLFMACVFIIFSLPRFDQIQGLYTSRLQTVDQPLKRKSPFINYTLSCGSDKSNRSCVFLIEKKDQYLLGDRILVGIVLNKGQSKVEQEDKSDLLCVFARNISRGTGSTGEVIYQGQGKYIAILRALWVGRSTVQVIIRATGSSFEKINETLMHHSSGRDFYCYFEYSKHRETTRAYMVFNKGVLGEKYCNLTGENYGYPLYCLKPRTRELQCTDWTRIKSSPTNTSLITNIQSGVVHVKANVTVDVISKTKENLWLPSVLCERKHFKETWTRHSPIGFFYNNTWHSTHCRGVTSQNSIKLNICLKNRTIRLFGDSTVRQLFLRLKETLEAIITTENIRNKGAIHRPIRAVAPGLNTTLYWGLHGIPLGYEPMYRGVLRPIHVNLDLIPVNSNDIIIFGIFLHFVTYNQKIFKAHMQRIAKSVRELLNRAPNVKIAIKGPHSILRPKVNFVNIYGIVGYIYRKIIFEEFYHLRDRVVFLDEMDLTIAMENDDIHPNRVVVSALVDHFLLYTCTS